MNGAELWNMKYVNFRNSNGSGIGNIEQIGDEKSQLNEWVGQ